MQKSSIDSIWLVGLLLFSGLLLSSCSKAIYKKLQKDIDLKAKAFLKGTVDSGKEFDGLKAITENGSSDTTDVLLVHGVRVDKVNHFHGLMSTLAQELGFAKSLDFPDSPINYHVINQDSIPMITRYSYCKNCDGSSGPLKLLRFYEVYWSPVTKQKKEVIKSCFDDIPNRAKLSRIIKQYSLIDVFADLTIYLGKNKKRIQDPVNMAIDTMMNEANTNKVVLTGSFGSQIVFDLLAEEIKTSIVELNELHKYERELFDLNATPTSKTKLDISNHFNNLFKQQRSIYEAQKDSLYLENIDADSLIVLINILEDGIRKYEWDKETVTSVNPITQCIYYVEQKQRNFRHFIQEIDCFFMLSNQLPFTGMLNLSPNEQYNSNTYNYVYQNLDTLLKDELKIVSFYDPNDVFGYRLPEPVVCTNLEVINVELHNTVPFYFNPDSLRLKYLSAPGNGGAMQKLVGGILKQGVESQSLVLDIDDPNQLAQHNPGIIKHLIEGETVTSENEKVLVLTKEFKKGLPPKTKVAKFNYPEISNVEGKNACVAKYQKTPGRWLTKQIGKPVLNSFNRKIKKLEIKRAYLPYEQIDPNIKFNGLQSALDQNDTLHILTVHGMVSKGPNHFDEMIEKLSTSLHFNPVPIRERWINIPLAVACKKSCYTFRDSFENCLGGCVNSLESCQIASEECTARLKICKDKFAAADDHLCTCDGLTEPAQLKVVEYQNNQEKIIRFYVLHWSPITNPPKAIIKKLDSENEFKEQRSALPAGIKNTLMNDGFVDVILSLNDQTYRPLIDQSIKEAFNTLLLKDPFDPTSISKTCSQDKNIFFISGSLGSKLLFDYYSTCLEKSTIDLKDWQSTIPHVSDHREVQHAVNISHRLHTFFMLSNQLPLISIRDMDAAQLKRLQERNKSDDWGDIIYNDWGNWINSTKYKDTLNIVAFYDPNDILGFPLQDENISGHLNVTNVPINLAAGFEINVHKLLKLSRKLDRILFQSILGEQYGKNNKRPQKLYKKKRNDAKLGYKKKKRAAQLKFDLKKCNSSSSGDLELATAILESTKRTLYEDLKREKKSLRQDCKGAIKSKPKNTLSARKQLKNLQKKLDLSITTKLLPILDLNQARQVFIFDLLTAHEGGKRDDRVIEMINFGTKGVKIQDL